jgi:hypothetical protein
VEEGKGVNEIAGFMVNNSDAVVSKMFNLGLKQLKEKDNGRVQRRLSSSFNHLRND